MARLELDRSIQSQPVLSNQIWKVTATIWFTDYRLSPGSSGFANTTLRPSFQMWENAKFMDTECVTMVSVSAYTIEEFARWGFD